MKDHSADVPKAPENGTIEAQQQQKPAEIIDALVDAAVLTNKEEEATIFPRDVVPQVEESSSNDANVAAGQQKKSEDEVTEGDREEESTATAAENAATDATDANIAGGGHQQPRNKAPNYVKEGEVVDHSSSSPSDFLSSLFASSSSGKTSSGSGRSGQKVETSDPKDTIAAVNEYLLGTTAEEGVAQQINRILKVEQKVTATLLLTREEGDSGPESKKLIYGQLVSVSGDPRVYIVWTDEGSSTSGGIQQYVEPLDGGRKAFFALVQAGAVNIPGANNTNKSTNTVTQQSSVSSSSAPSPAEVIDLSSLSATTTTIPPSSAAAADSDVRGTSSSTCTDKSSSNNSSSNGANKSSNGSNWLALEVHDLTQLQEESLDDNNEKKNAPHHPPPSEVLSKEEYSAFLATGLVPPRFLSAYEESENRELLATGLSNLAVLQELFHVLRGRRGVRSLGVSAQGGGDIAITNSSVKSVIGPFFLKFMLQEKLGGRFGSSNIASSSLSSSSSSIIENLSSATFPPATPVDDEEVSKVLWFGAGSGQETRDLLLQLNGYNLANYITVHMTDIDRAAVERFNSSPVQMPSVTYSLVDENSLGSYMVPGGGQADLLYTTMMNGPQDYLCILASAFNNKVRFLLSFERNLAYLAPVMKNGALVAARLGVVHTTGGTANQMMAVEVYAADRKVR